MYQNNKIFFYKNVKKINIKEKFIGNIYDLIIIGSGPAGLSAGLYGARAKLKTLILEKGKTGGQIVTTHDVANYPGSVENASGPKLIARMVEQCKSFGAEMKS